LSRIPPTWWIVVGLWALPVPAGADCEWDFGVKVGDDCGAVPAEGCCKDGAYRYWCDGGVLCMEECFFADCGYVMLMGYQCGTLMGVGADSCPAIPAPCLADCLGRECGDDGCGGSCGSCYGGATCVQGRCEGACQPTCLGRECGDDGCGGSCGSCYGGATCVQGRCEGACQPTCLGRECGDDGCGGSCGTCSGGKTCKDGACALPDCTPDCSGRECGDNGCGGTCGTCPDTALCKDGRCEAPQVCHPACDGKECGPDGCDGYCGVCPRGMTCDARGICLEEGESCVPWCQGRDCGDDGCGGLCGVCEVPLVCRAGKCESPDPTDGQDSGSSGDAAETPPPAGDSEDAVPPVRCPAGQQLLYGSCVPTPGDSSARGGCASGTRPVPLAGIPWALAAMGLAIRTWRPRRRR